MSGECHACYIAVIVQFLKEIFHQVGEIKAYCWLCDFRTVQQSMV